MTAERRALVVRGGWDGHMPVETTAVFIPFLQQHGFEVRIENGTAIYRDAAYLEKQMQVATLIRAHRVRGHLIADLDPLGWQEPKMHDELDPATYGLTIWDLEREFLTGGLAGQETMKLGKILHVLRDAYCRSIGIEYMHIQETDEQRWIQSKVEGVPFQLSNPELRHLLGRLNAAEAFEKFLATKYVGTKRFGLEGAESAIPILDTILSAAADDGSAGVVLGMAHRGRLNVLANIVGKSYDQIFREFEGYVDPNSVQGSGDVKYHLGAVGKYVSAGFLGFSAATGIVQQDFGESLTWMIRHPKTWGRIGHVKSASFMRASALRAASLFSFP